MIRKEKSPEPNATGKPAFSRRRFLKNSTVGTSGLLFGIPLLNLVGGCDKTIDETELITIQTSFTKDYLIPLERGYLLIDTSYEEQYETFLEKLNQQGIKKEEISYLLLTHHHDDHSGFAARLLQETDARLIVHKRALPYITRGVASTQEKPLNSCTKAVFSVFSLFKANSDHSYPAIVPREKDIIIRGDVSDFIKTIGIDGKIVYTPGHTDDSMSLVLADGRTFVGDAAMDLLNFCLCDRRPIYYNNYDQVFTSWRHLLSHGAKMIYPAHGNPFNVSELDLQNGENGVTS